MSLNICALQMFNELWAIMVKYRLCLVCIIIRSVSQPTKVLTRVCFWKLFLKLPFKILVKDTWCKGSKYRTVRQILKEQQVYFSQLIATQKYLFFLLDGNYTILYQRNYSEWRYMMQGNNFLSRQLSFFYFRVYCCILLKGKLDSVLFKPLHC